MNDQGIAELASELGPWYHEIEILPGLTPESCMTASKPQWAAVRTARFMIDYTGKSVLDIGTMDGMWAFEAENLGASLVIGADVYQGRGTGGSSYERFMLARQCLSSRVVMVPNGDCHKLHDRFETIRRSWGIDGFDIIQCLGMLYHSMNPMLALREIRRCCNSGGVMLLETACWNGGGSEPLARANFDRRVYNDESTHWLPNIACLLDMLTVSGFSARMGHASFVESGPYANRIAVVCDAVKPTVNSENGPG